MKETFEDYLQRLKDRRTEDDYKYTDEDFKKYERYIRDCCKNGMSVYKCLEFMWFQTEEAEISLKNKQNQLLDDAIVIHSTRTGEIKKK